MCDLGTVLGVENIAYLQELDRKNFHLVDKHGLRRTIQGSLKKLMKDKSREEFFCLLPSLLVHVHAITKMEEKNNLLEITLQPSLSEKIVLHPKKANRLRKWLGKHYK